MEKIDLTYLADLAEDAAQQLRQLIQNQGKKIVEAINKQLKEADDEEPVVFKLGHAISIDLTEMKIKGKLSFSIKSSTELVTAIMDPEQPEFELGDGKRGKMGVAGEGDSGATLVPEGDAMPGRTYDDNFTCSVCDTTFDDEEKAEDHISGPACSPPEEE